MLSGYWEGFDDFTFEDFCFDAWPFEEVPLSALAEIDRDFACFGADFEALPFCEVDLFFDCLVSSALYLALIYYC